MPRYYAPISLEEFKNKIITLLHIADNEESHLWKKPWEPVNKYNSIEGWRHYCSYIRTLTPTIIKDFDKVKVDTENVEFEPQDEDEDMKHIIAYQQIGDFVFFGFYCGGDWENPVFHIIYWDGKELRGYIPSQGNPYNRQTMQAYGNQHGPEYDDETFEENEEHMNEQFDAKLLLKDILNRIQKKP